MSTPIASLPNLGDKTALWLEAVGINSEDDLHKNGVIGTCRKLLLNGQNINLIMAYALAGAIYNHHWNKLPDELKEQTKLEFRGLQQELGLR